MVCKYKIALQMGMGGAGKSAPLSLGKLDRFCLATFDEESGNVHVINEALEAFKAAVAQIHHGKVAVMSAIGNRGSETTYVLNLLIKEGSQFQRRGSSSSKYVPKFPEKCEQGGLYALILRNPIIYPYPATSVDAIRNIRVRLVFLNAVYSGKNVILYQKLAMFCMTVSSMLVVLYGFDGSQENLVKMEDLLDAYTRSGKRGSLQFATVIFSHRPVEEGLKEYETTEDFVTEFLESGGKNSSKDKLRNVVSFLEDAGIPLRIAVVENLIKVYSKENVNRKKLKLFLPRSFDRLDASRLTNTATADIQEALRLINETVTLTLNTNSSSVTKPKQEEILPKPAEIPTNVSHGSTFQMKKPSRYVSALMINRSTTPPKKTSNDVERDDSVGTPSQPMATEVRREESLKGVPLPVIQPEIEGPSSSSSSSNLKTDPDKRIGDQDRKLGVEGSTDGRMINYVTANLVDSPMASNWKRDSGRADARCTAPKECSTDEKQEDSTAAKASQRNEQRTKSDTKFDLEGTMRPDLPDYLEQLEQATNQPLLVGAVHNQRDTGNSEDSGASENSNDLHSKTEEESTKLNSSLGGQAPLPQEDPKDWNVMDSSTAPLKRNPVEQDPLSAPRSSPDYVTSLTCHHADWTLSESTLQEYTKPDTSCKMSPLPKYQILERIKSIDVNTEDMTAIRLHRDFHRLAVLFQVYTEIPEEMKDTFKAEVDRWTSAYVTKVANPELKHTFQSMQLDLLNTFAYIEEYNRLIRERFDSSPLDIWYSVQSFAEDAKNRLSSPKYEMTGRLADMLNTVLYCGINRMLEDQERRNNEAIQLESLLAKRARDESFEYFNNVMNQVLAARAYSKPTLRKVFMALAKQILQVFDAKVFALSPAFQNERETLIQSIEATYEEKTLINERNCVRSRKDCLFQRERALKTTNGVDYEQAKSNTSSEGQKAQKSTTENLQGATLGISDEQGEVTAETLSTPASYLHPMGKQEESNQMDTKIQSEIQNPEAKGPGPSNGCIELETTIRELEALISNDNVPVPVVKEAKVKVEEARGILSNPSSAPMKIKYQMYILKDYMGDLRQWSK